MNHEMAQELLDEWLDGELDAARSAAVASHAEACSGCSSDAEARRRLARALFSQPAPRGREAFVASVMAGVSGEEAPPSWAPQWLSPALGVAFAALLAGFLLRGVGPEDPYDGLLSGSGYAAVEDR